MREKELETDALIVGAGGDYLNNPKSVNILVNQASARAKDMDRYGTNFDREGQ